MTLANHLLSEHPIILYREHQDNLDELEIAKKYFEIFAYRSHVPDNHLVIPRYSALPFYEELEVDLKTKNSKLINSYVEHRWISSFSWYDYLEEFTPKSWREWQLPSCNHPGPFVVKGTTNSRKHQWRTHMFAETKKDALIIASELANDPLIGPQGIIYREYVPLKVLEVCPIYGTPFVNEWRFFFFREELLSHGFYWTNCSVPEKATIGDEAFELARKIAKIASAYTNFFVLDLAQKEDGEWILVEVNDGSMSGLSDCNADELYRNLFDAVRIDLRKRNDEARIQFNNY